MAGEEKEKRKSPEEAIGETILGAAARSARESETLRNEDVFPERQSYETREDSLKRRAAELAQVAAKMGTITSSSNAEQQDRDTSLSFYERTRELSSFAWKRLTPLQRLQVTNGWTITAQVITALCFAVWAASFPIGPFKNFALISEAFAQSATPASSTRFDPKPFIHLMIFVMLFGAFFVSIWVSYFGKSEKAADNAGTVAKTLLGFFIGAATNYLGIVSPTT
jgi:hypothetical protein